MKPVIALLSGVLPGWAFLHSSHEAAILLVALGVTASVAVETSPSRFVVRNWRLTVLGALGFICLSIGTWRVPTLDDRIDMRDVGTLGDAAARLAASDVYIWVDSEDRDLPLNELVADATVRDVLESMERASGTQMVNSMPRCANGQPFFPKPALRYALAHDRPRSR